MRLPGFTDPLLELTCAGTIYTVPAPSISAGVRLLQSLDDPVTGVDRRQLALGAAAEAMRRDNVPAGFYARAGETAVVDFVEGRDRAEQVWLHGPNAPRPAQHALRGLESMDAYGRGEKDPLTGIWEWYEDLPPEAAAEPADDAAAITWSALFAAWDVIEHAFPAHLGLELEDVWEQKTWRWFKVQIRGLLTTDTSLAAHFRPAATPSPERPDDALRE